VSFADVGVKDVTDFLAWFTVTDLVKGIGTDWLGLAPVHIDGCQDDEIVVYSDHWGPSCQIFIAETRHVSCAMEISSMKMKTG
jgi:hypothetical protein